MDSTKPASQASKPLPLSHARHTHTHTHTTATQKHNHTSTTTATQKHKHCADHINSVPILELQLEQVHSQHNPSGIQLGCFHRAHTLESRGAIHSQYGQSGSDRRMGKARGSVALRGSRQDSQHPHTHLREPKPPINHFGLCGQNGFGVPTLTKTRVSQPTNGCTSLCLAPSFPYTFGPLARGLTPNQGGIRTAGRKSIGSWARFTLRSFARDCK